LYLCHKTIFRMKTNYQLRYASNPVDAKNYDTKRLRVGVAYHANASSTACKEVAR